MAVPDIDDNGGMRSYRTRIYAGVQSAMTTDSFAKSRLGFDHEHLDRGWQDKAGHRNPWRLDGYSVRVDLLNGVRRKRAPVCAVPSEPVDESHCRATRVVLDRYSPRPNSPQSRHHAPGENVFPRPELTQRNFRRDESALLTLWGR